MSRPGPGPAPDRLIELGTAYWASRTLLSAVELGVFAALAAGPLPVEELRDRLGLHRRGARDFLDALVALDLLDRDNDGYRNSAETDLYLDPAKASYLGGMLEFHNRSIYLPWATLTEALRTGEAQTEFRNEEDQFAAVYRDPDRLTAFLTAMSGYSAGSAIALANTFPWDRYQTFCDLGAAQGMVPVQLALRHPHLRGVGFDLPQVQPIFEKFVADHGLSSRVGQRRSGRRPTARSMVLSRAWVPPRPSGASGKPCAGATNRSESWPWSQLNPPFCRAASPAPTRSTESERVLSYRSGGKASPIRLNKSAQRRPPPWSPDLPGKKDSLPGHPPAGMSLPLCDWPNNSDLALRSSPSCATPG